MKNITDKNVAFTFASSEVNKFSQNFIKIVELLSGKLTLKKLYDQYLAEKNPHEDFWKDAIRKLDIKISTHYHSTEGIPQNGRLIIVANHAFGVADGVSICSLISDVRQDYKMITHKVLRYAEAVKEKIIPIDFANTKDAMISNIKARRSAEDILKKKWYYCNFPFRYNSNQTHIGKKNKSNRW